MTRRHLLTRAVLVAACAAGLIVFAQRLDGWVLVLVVGATVLVAARFSAEVDAYGAALDDHDASTERELDAALGIERDAR